MVLQEHLDKCNTEKKYDEAEKAKQRILQFERLQKEQDKKRLDSLHKTNKQFLKEDYESNLRNLKIHQQDQTNQINANFEEITKDLEESHKMEQHAVKQEFLLRYPKQPKYSAEVLNMQKITEDLAKKKEFGRAHEMQEKMRDKMNQEDEKFRENRQKKLQKEMAKLEKKHKMNLTSLNKKREKVLTEMNKAMDTQMSE